MIAETGLIALWLAAALALLQFILGAFAFSFAVGAVIMRDVGSNLALGRDVMGYVFQGTLWLPGLPAVQTTGAP